MTGKITRMRGNCDNCHQPIDGHCQIHLVPCCPGKCPEQRTVRCCAWCGTPRLLAELEPINSRSVACRDIAACFARIERSRQVPAELGWADVERACALAAKLLRAPDLPAAEALPPAEAQALASALVLAAAERVAHLMGKEVAATTAR